VEQIVVTNDSAPSSIQTVHAAGIRLPAGVRLGRLRRGAFCHYAPPFSFIPGIPIGAANVSGE
jgi:hypothetical protein